MANPTADLRQKLADHEADKDKQDTTISATYASTNEIVIGRPWV